MRYLGPVFKKARRYGISILENEKEFSKGKKRTYAPGQHGNKRVKLSDYGLHLYEKQKVRFIYGISEKQLQKIYARA
ncbi:30S ribosomal protein S4, partial [Escherichia coli]|nr:30S ribosomal protein S4 [Escherichia coli]